MAKVHKRSPKVTKKNLRQLGGRAKSKHVELYSKKIAVELVGQNPEDLQAVARAMYEAAGNHEKILGGKLKKSVHVSYERTPPTKIFDGTVSPDGVK